MWIACKQIIALNVLLFLLVATTGGQPKCKIEYYSTEHGLSHQAVNAMLKDREGFMWFGSWDGINRFDGQKFVSYKSSPGDLSQLGNDRIDQIMEDQANHLWILAYDRQIYRFNKKTGQYLPLVNLITPDGRQKISFRMILAATNGLVWLLSENDGLFCVDQNEPSKDRLIRYKKELSAAYHLPSNTIIFFHEDREHRIWIGTPDGLCCLERHGSGTYANNRPVPPNIASGISLTGIVEDADHLYFGTSDGSIITYDKASNSFSVQKIASGSLHALCRSNIRDVLYATSAGREVITLDLKDKKITTVIYKPSEPLFSMYEDRKGVLWIEPEKLGVVRFDPGSRSFRFFSQKVEDPHDLIGNRFKVFEDNSGLVWVNMKGGGFGYYDTAKSSIDYFPDAANLPGYKLPSVVYLTYYDSSGIIWLRTYGRELVKIILQGNDFTQQRLVDTESILADNEIRGIFHDNKNRLWLGTKSGRLFIRQNEQWLTGLFTNEPAQGLGQVYSIIEDSRGNIWFATKKNGVLKAIPVNKEETKYRLVNYLADKNNSNGLTSNQIYALLEDRHGRIWIGTFDNGLVLAVGDGDSVQFIHAGNAFINYPKGGFKKIRHMALDSEGNIWIGTTNGLLLLNSNNQHAPVYQYKAYSKIPGDKQSLGNNDIQFIFRDSKKRMWLATSGGGFCLAIGDKPFQALRFRNYTTQDGLPNDYVLSCAEDGDGNIWLATENGLSKFNPENRTFRNYDAYDGLPKLGFSEAAACRQLPDGRLIFGTTDGFLSFYPEQISTGRIPANIVLTNLQINNEIAGPGTNSTVLKTDINYVSALTLKYNQNIISIDYAILDQRAGNRQGFAYWLKGFDTTWHDDRQFRRATYTNLPPGNYVFEVKSLSTDLYSNQPYRRLAITILPPPWKTGWAFMLYALAAGIILFFIRRYALTVIRLRNKIAVEQKLAILKMNFFTNVSHELRTPLSLIVHPLELVAKNEKLTPEGASSIDMARKNAARMVRFINQLLDLRKVQSDKARLQMSGVELIAFVHTIADHFTEAARSKRIRLEVVSAQKELMAWIDAEKLDVVVYNLLSNAVKFTPEGKQIQILINTIPEEERFSISVYDQGPGVPKEKLEAIFELFHEGEHLNGRALKGTGIGLALAREFVVLHGGRIWAENNRDGGLTVTVELKLGAVQFKKDNIHFADLPQAVPDYESPVEQQIIPHSLSSNPPEGEQASLVLLVEDNDELRNYLKAQLSTFYRVETASDGEEGLQKALSLIPDLMVSDIMMPKMDGIQLLDKVKNNSNTSHIPVVLLSAKYALESQIEGLKYGADYYVTKPFNNKFLIASIDNLIRQRKKVFEALVEKKETVALSPSPVVITLRDETFLKEVIKVVEEKMAEPDFTIESLAETMAMNTSTFYKKFKSLSGLTSVEFVRDMRLQRAKQLLDAGGSNVSEVAYEVGFSNPKYFSTCFKEKYHVSPSDYVKSKAM